MASSNFCSECGAEISPGAQGSLCPRCLFALALTASSDPDSTASHDSVTEQPGDRIGGYKLLQQIGEGGCGVVYMAEQEEPVRRRVALKVIKLGMDTKQVIARFEAERQALALMDHPNIAKVLDGGATDAGRPYFVMELVRGVKITEYCDEAKLSTRDRLDLFIKVCQAIQHAHQKGIIHRDIKPSNILVTLHDGVPVPKVNAIGGSPEPINASRFSGNWRGGPIEIGKPNWRSFGGQSGCGAANQSGKSAATPSAPWKASA
jgi:serine/threonine protein kinase